MCGVLAEAVTGPTAGRSPRSWVSASTSTSDRAELPVPTATSLRLAGAATLDRDTVLRACLRAVAVRYRQWVDAGGDPRAAGVGAAYREACLTLGQEVEVRLPGEGAGRWCGGRRRRWTTTAAWSSRPPTACGRWPPETSCTCGRPDNGTP